MYIRIKRLVSFVSLFALSACSGGKTEKSYLDASSFPASCQSSEGLASITSRLRTCSNKNPDAALTELCLSTLRPLYDSLPADCRESIDTRELLGRAARTITKNGICMTLAKVQEQAKPGNAAAPNELSVDFGNIAKFTMLWLGQFEPLYFDGTQLDKIALEQKLGREYSISDISADILQTIQTASSYAQQRNTQEAAQPDSKVEPENYSVYAVKQHTSLLKATLANYKESKESPLFFAFIVSQVLSSMQSDVQSVGAVHDMICALSSCAQSSSRSSLVKMVDLIAAIGDENSFRLKLAEAKAEGVFADGAGSYLEFLNIVDANPDLVQRAISRSAQLLGMEEILNGRLVSANVYGAQQNSLIAQSFLEQLKNFQVMARRYDMTGRLVSSEFGGQSYPFNKELFRNILLITNDFGNQIDSRLARYTADRANFLNTLRAGLDDSTRIVDNKITVDNLKADLVKIGSDIEGLQAALEDSEASFAGYASQLDLLKSVQDGLNSYDVVRNIDQIKISAADARMKEGDSFKRTLKPVDYQVTKTDKISLEAGQILVLETTGRWAPRCALRKNATGELLNQVNTITTGPEGYVLSVSTEKASISSQVDGKRETKYKDRASVTAQCIEAEIKIPVVNEAASVSGKMSACENYTSGKRNEDYSDTSETVSNSSRTMANFASGMRLPETPFDFYPVGSLLAFAMPKNASASTYNNAVDIKVLSGRTTFIAEQDLDFYLVVNDCVDGNDSQESLGVSGAVLTSKANLIEADRKALFAAVGTMRKNGERLLKEGLNISAQLEDLKQKALADTVSSQALSSTPALQELFRYWINHEALQISRKAQIEERRREYSRIFGELQRNLAQVESLKSAAMLRQLQIKLELDNLDERLLTDYVKTTSQKIATEFAPIINFYFEKQDLPASLNTTANDLLKTMSIATPASSLARKARQFIDKFGTETQAWRDKLNLTEYDHIVGLRFPSPVYQSLYRDPANPDAPVIDKLRYLPQASDAQSLELWNSLFISGSKSRPVITPDFNQLYGQGLSGYLPCNLYKPTITDMAIVFVTKNTNVSETTLADLNSTVSLPLILGPTTRIPTQHGPQELTFTSGVLQPTAKVGFVLDSAAANFNFIGNVLERKFDSGAGAGLSPFTNLAIRNDGLPEFLALPNVQKFFGIESKDTKPVSGKPSLPFGQRPEKSAIYPSALTDIIIVYALRTLSIPESAKLDYISSCN